MKLYMGDTRQDLATAAQALQNASIALEYPQTYYPGGYPGGGYYGPPIYPSTPPGTVQGGVDTTVPVIPVALGAAAGWYWKKSPLAAIVGAIAGFILGNIFGSVAVQSQVQATPLQPSNTPYGY